jgi:hypothetical protein
MGRILKDILNDVLSQSGFLMKDSFTGSADIDDLQMVAIANRVATEIKNFYPWSHLRKSTFITVESDIVEGPNGAVEWVKTGYELPADFAAFMPDSMREGDGGRKVEFPTDNDEWYALQFSDVGGGGVQYAQRIGNNLVLHSPTVGNRIKYGWVSKYAVIGGDGVAKERFTNDTDTWALDETVLTLGIQAHWAQTKLLPQYEEWFKNYSMKVTEAIGRDAGAKTIGGVQRRDNRSPYTPLYLPS